MPGSTGFHSGVNNRQQAKKCRKYHTSSFSHTKNEPEHKTEKPLRNNPTGKSTTDLNFASFDPHLSSETQIGIHGHRIEQASISSCDRPSNIPEWMITVIPILNGGIISDGQSTRRTRTAAEKTKRKRLEIIFPTPQKTPENELQNQMKHKTWS
jgi:hypothetical protein